MVKAPEEKLIFDLFVGFEQKWTQIRNSEEILVQLDAFLGIIERFFNFV